ncbi:serine/threonine-protein kinase [Prosthecobacter sp.]|uniref:serine/threonine-protein kinase n=1 Tax=Prosthecobacter sp. TaxID=1965333 RepID=UPI0037836506
MSENPAHDSPVGWTPPPPEHLEAMLPQYDEWEMIGCGGMGAVYKARQISLDRPVAIKVLPPQVAENEADYITRFKNEARTMARMNHPAIVSVYDFGATPDGLLYFVMEYIDGTDVFKMIQAQRRLPVEHALAITAHVCDALAYAHEHKVIHRDIKPANILINMDGAVKVADFGLASIHDPAQDSGTTQEGSTLGTPDYVAPEVLTIGMTVDGRADLYSVGVMLYNMLTGKIPRGTFQMPSERIGCDKRYDAIVRKAMEPDPDRRYQTARELRRDLDQILTVPVAKEKPASSSASAPAGQPLRGMLPRPLPPPPPPPRTPWGMIAAALIVVGGAVILLTWGGRSSSSAPATGSAEAEPLKQEPAVSSSTPPAPESAPAMAPAGPDAPSKRPRPPGPPPPPPPPPVTESEGSKQLRELAASFHTALEREVLAVHRAASTDLNTKYLAALDRAVSAAMTAARLPEALALREEKQLITSQSPLPVEDAPDLPPSLRALRATYRASLRPIDAARDSGLASLFTKYEEVLKARQAEWTQAGKLEDARLADERIARLPRERAAVLNEARELLPGGREIVLQKRERFTSAETFTPPLEFTIVAKTKKDDLRLACSAKQVIFNWETRPDELRIDNDPGGARHVPGMGRIPEDTFVTIRWRILPHMQSIEVDGKRRLLHFGDYSRVSNALEIFPLNDAVTVKSATVKLLDLSALEDQVSSVPAMRAPLLTRAEWTGRLTIPAGTYHPLRRIDIGAPGRRDPKAQNDEQRGDVTSLPGMRMENVRFHLREGSWHAAGGHFQDVKVTADLGGSFEARDSLFQDCVFAKEGVWYIAFFSTKWQFTNCVLTGSFMQGWKLLDIGMKLDSCTLINVDLVPLGYKEDAAQEAGKDWLSLQNCRFVNCRVPESFALATKNCVFEKCTFGPPEDKLPVKSALKAVIYVQDCTNSPTAGAGRSIETRPATQLTTNAGASLPCTFTNGRLDFQSPPQ